MYGHSTEYERRAPINSSDWGFTQTVANVRPSSAPPHLLFLPFIPLFAQLGYILQPKCIFVFKINNKYWIIKYSYSTLSLPIGLAHRTVGLSLLRLRSHLQLPITPSPNMKSAKRLYARIECTMAIWMCSIAWRYNTHTPTTETFISCETVYRKAIHKHTKQKQSCLIENA